MATFFSKFKALTLRSVLINFITKNGELQSVFDVFGRF